MTPTIRVQLSKRSQILAPRKSYLTDSMVVRLALHRWRTFYKRIAEQERKGLVHVAYSSDCWPRARTAARAQAKAEGRLWTRADDAAFRSTRKKTKALNVTAEKRLKAETKPAPSPKKRKRSANDSQPISNAPVKRTKRKT